MSGLKRTRKPRERGWRRLNAGFNEAIIVAAGMTVTRTSTAILTPSSYVPSRVTVRSGLALDFVWPGCVRDALAHKGSKSMKRILLLFLAASTFLAADYPSDATVKEEWKRLEGSWTLTKAELLGKSLLQKDDPEHLITIKDGMITSDKKTAPKDDVLDSSTVKLDPTADPKTITIPNWKGPEGPVSWIGIYEIKSDELKICITSLRKAKLSELETFRPKAFDSNHGALLIFKRETK
jgi:uncharacterized protein (TIGR03067 family)